MNAIIQYIKLILTTVSYCIQATLSRIKVLNANVFGLISTKLQHTYGRNPLRPQHHCPKKFKDFSHSPTIFKSFTSWSSEKHSPFWLRSFRQIWQFFVGAKSLHLYFCPRGLFIAGNRSINFPFGTCHQKMKVWECEVFAAPFCPNDQLLISADSVNSNKPTPFAAQLSSPITPNLTPGYQAAADVASPWRHRRTGG